MRVLILSIPLLSSPSHIPNVWPCFWKYWRNVSRTILDVHFGSSWGVEAIARCCVFVLRGGMARCVRVCKLSNVLVFNLKGERWVKLPKVLENFTPSIKRQLGYGSEHGQFYYTVGIVWKSISLFFIRVASLHCVLLWGMAHQFDVTAHGTKRPAEGELDDQPLAKKFGRLKIGMPR